MRTDRQGSYALKNIPPGDYRLAAADLPPDVWLDAETLSTLSGHSVTARVESPRALMIDLSVP